MCNSGKELCKHVISRKIQKTDIYKNAEASLK